MAKYLIGIVVLIALAGGGYYLWSGMQNEPVETPDPTPQEPILHTYATSTFSISYPSEFTLDERYAYEGVPGKPIAGVKFSIPDSMATGTTLSAFDTGVSVETLPRAQQCTGDIFVLQNVRASEVVENGVEYSLATTSSAGAGNLYEEWIYALSESSPCMAVRYFVHSTALANHAGTVREFDRTGLLRIFDGIRHSLTLGSSTPVQTFETP